MMYRSELNSYIRYYATCHEGAVSCQIDSADRAKVKFLRKLIFAETLS